MEAWVKKANAVLANEVKRCHWKLQVHRLKVRNVRLGTCILNGTIILHHSSYFVHLIQTSVFINCIEEVEVKIDDMIVYEDEEEFMMWSLGDNKADLTPKKFAKMNPRMAMKLIAGDVSVDEILQKREKMLAKIEG